ncbi:MAG: Gfo/Idh/MocA family oxidoreductase [Thermoguttaceae bacterium]
MTTNRRTFLRHLALGTAALSIPSLVPSSVLGRDGNVAPSERITMGLIGCGIHGLGWNLDLMLRNREQQVVAVCDVDKNHKEAAKKKVESAYSERFGTEYKGCLDFDDFRDLVNQKSIDAVDIVTPDHWHSLISVFAMKAGKHVICEKPTLTIKEGRLVSNVQKETGRVFLTASENRTVDDYQHIINVVRNGKIGKLQNIKVLLPPGNVDRTEVSKNVEPIPDYLDYEKWIGPAAMIPYIPARLHNTWRWHLQFSGGSMTDWGSHNINLAQWANESDETGPVEIHATKSDYPDENAVWTTTPTFDFNCRYSNGVTMQVWSEVPGIKFEGTNGWIMIRGYRGKMTASDDSLLTWKPGSDEIDVAKELSYCTVGRSGTTALGDILGGEHVNFTHCIKTGQIPYYTAECGHRNHSIAHLAQISMKLGNVPLKWNPETEQCEGENAQSAMNSMFMSRKQREPWTFENVDSWINVG